MAGSDRGALAASRLMGWAVVAESLCTAGLGPAGQLAADAIDLSEWLPGAVIVGVLLVAFFVGRLYEEKIRLVRIRIDSDRVSSESRCRTAV